MTSSWSWVSRLSPKYQSTRAVVAEDAEVVRYALGVDVPDIGRDAVCLERGDVLVEVLRRATPTAWRPG